jgi:hypothetical protein
MQFLLVIIPSIIVFIFHSFTELICSLNWFIYKLTWCIDSSDLLIPSLIHSSHWNDSFIILNLSWNWWFIYSFSQSFRSCYLLNCLFIHDAFYLCMCSTFIFFPEFVKVRHYWVLMIGLLFRYFQSLQEQLNSTS